MADFTVDKLYKHKSFSRMSGEWQNRMVKHGLAFCERYLRRVEYLRKVRNRTELEAQTQASSEWEYLMKKIAERNGEMIADEDFPKTMDDVRADVVQNEDILADKKYYPEEKGSERGPVEDLPETADAAKSLVWVVQKLGNKRVQPKDAPDQLARTLLNWGRKDPTHEKALIEMFLKRVSVETDEGELDLDGAADLKQLERVEQLSSLANTAYSVGSEVSEGEPGV